MSRKNFKLVVNVPITDIKLDVGNPRIRDGHDEPDCISRILRKEDQLMALMADIAENGLTTMPILVKPVDDKWVVMDGNRRVTALKLLNDVSLCPEERLKPSIQTLQQAHKGNIPQSIDVLSSSNDEAIAKEVLSRHSGAQGGVGQLDWSAYLRTVYLLNHGHPPDYKRPGQYALWAEKQGIWVDDEFPISSLQRFFTIENLYLLGFVIESDELVPAVSLDLAKRMAQMVMTDFATTLKVDHIRTPDLARNYIGGVRTRVGLIEVPSTPTTSDNVSSPLVNAPIDDGAVPANLPTPQPITPPSLPVSPLPLRPRPSPTPILSAWDRKQLFGRRGPNLQIPESELKARTLVAEIRKLDVKETSLAAAMLLRGFLELSDGYYRANQSLPDVGKLGKNVLASATHMRDSEKISISEFDIVKRLAVPDARDELLHIETLQKVMHRDTHHPNYQLVNTVWDNLAPFVRACWSS